MNKAQLVTAISEKTNTTKKSAEESLNVILEIISNTMAKGEKIQLVGFGSFGVKRRAARKGRNPQTREEIKIPACNAPTFKAGKGLKEIVSKK